VTMYVQREFDESVRNVNQSSTTPRNIENNSLYASMTRHMSLNDAPRSINVKVRHYPAAAVAPTSAVAGGGYDVEREATWGSVIGEASDSDDDDDQSKNDYVFFNVGDSPPPPPPPRPPPSPPSAAAAAAASQREYSDTTQSADVESLLRPRLRSAGISPSDDHLQQVMMYRLLYHTSIRHAVTKYTTNAVKRQIKPLKTCLVICDSQLSVAASNLHLCFSSSYKAGL